MAEQWIAAATARDLVGSVTAISAAHSVLCTRAHSGLITTRAKLLVYGSQRATDATIPPEFWWANGEAAFKQDWETGDFSTWIDHKIECQAFGVTFPLTGILDMLPIERRAEITRQLSVAGRAGWIGIAEAVGLACRLPGVISGRDYIVEQARLGLLQGQAVLAERFPTRHHAVHTWDEREWDIPAFVWEAIADPGNAPQHWGLGRLSGRVVVDGKSQWLRLSGVHILAAPLRDALSISVETVPEPTPKLKAGGRPPKPWWDDLWCDVWGLIHQGDLKPETQAEIENAMLTWAMLNGHEVSESTIRPKARKLFETYKGEVRNFLAL